jgi:hypothetical protein
MRRVSFVLLGLLACGDDSSGSDTDTDATSGASTSGSQTGADGEPTGPGGTTDASGTLDGGSDDDGSDTNADTDTDTGGPGACGEIPTFEDGRTPTSEIHVAMGGSDMADCGAEATPCATIAHAASMATPGTAVRVHEGTYAPDGYIANLSGTAEAPIWIGGAPGESRPVIEGGGQGLHLVSVRYVIVHDLEVRNASNNGINCDDGGAYADPDATRWLVFRDLFIHDIGSGGNQDCLKLSGVDDYWVLDSELATCGGGSAGSGIDHVGCHHGLIARNLFRDMQGAGNAVQCKGGSEDIEIRWNVMLDPGARGVNMGGSTGFEFFRPPLSESRPNAEARDIRVVANVIRGGTASLAFVGCHDCLAAHNTIVDPENWILRILQETTSTAEYTFVPAGNSRFVNNLVWFSRSQISTHVNIGGGTAAETFEITTNLWYAHDDPGQSDPSGDLPVAEVGGIHGQDPLLIDPAGGDHRPEPESPAVGAGTPLAGTSADLDGNCWNDPPTIGAFEL